MSLEMYNDEFDHFNKLPPGDMVDSDLYLKAALQEHNVAKQHRANNHTLKSNHSNKTNRSNYSNRTNHSNQTQKSNHINKAPPPPAPPLPPAYNKMTNGKLANGKMNGIDKNIYNVSNNLNHSPLPKKTAALKTKPRNGVSHTYDNQAFSPENEPYVTRNIDGLQTTDI